MNDDHCRLCGVIEKMKICDLKDCPYAGCENGKYGRLCGDHHIIIFSRIKELRGAI